MERLMCQNDATVCQRCAKMLPNLSLKFAFVAAAAVAFRLDKNLIVN
jgi:hypothetical protein